MQSASAAARSTSGRERRAAAAARSRSKQRQNLRKGLPACRGRGDRPLHSDGHDAARIAARRDQPARSHPRLLERAGLGRGHAGRDRRVPAGSSAAEHEGFSATTRRRTRANTCGPDHDPARGIRRDRGSEPGVRVTRWPLTFETEVTIERPRAEVAAYAADPDNVPSWYENIESVAWETEKPVAVGSTDRVRRPVPRPSARIHLRDHGLRSRRGARDAHSGGAIPMETSYRWDDARAAAPR